MDRNENSFISQIRPPSRIISPKKLAEAPPSVSNARPNTHMAPPQVNGLKRKTTADHVPAARPAPDLGASRIAGASARGMSLATIGRQASTTSSTSTRPSSTSYRNVSNSSYGSSVGSITRPSSSQSYRPQSAMSARPNQRLPSNSTRSINGFGNQTWTGEGQQMDISAKSIYPISSERKSSAERLLDRTARRKKHVVQNTVEVWSPSPPEKPATNSDYPHARSLRDISISSALNRHTLNPRRSMLLSVEEKENETSPSRLPKPVPAPSMLPLENATPFLTPCKQRQKPELGFFLTKESNKKSKPIVFDTDARLASIESMYSGMKEALDKTSKESDGLKESVSLSKTRIAELEASRQQLSNTNTALQQELDSTRANQLKHLNDVDEARRQHANQVDDLERQRRRDLDHAQRHAEEEHYRLKRSHDEDMTVLKRKLEDAVEREKESRQEELQALSSEAATAQKQREMELEEKERQITALQTELKQLNVEIDGEREVSSSLRLKLSDAATHAASIEAALRSSRARVEFLESDCKSQSQAFADLEQRTQDAIRIAAEANEKLRIEETLRRKLHNQVQELKGNIRVFCRVRPSLGSDPVNEAARIAFPDGESDSKEVEIMGPDERSSLGTVTRKKNAFSFDRVFTPKSENADVFGEISQLVQSALDGYNVCIFCYGQTGAGKTHTMSSEDGMIPRAMRQIYETARSLEEKGWKYSMEGSFIEVYNENINDLLGKADDLDKKKHEIRHDMQRCKTVITDVNTVDLDSPNKVETILKQAAANRSVAATRSNERSSRSHSVFILKLNGENSITGEKSEGTLNLVDLAGSERLSSSGATGERLKETQNINKSLSCLGDVISALGQGKEGGHVPYRNSKLTYLLQFSLGGNSKTLMFVMISPMQAHLNETLTSLKFATKASPPFDTQKLTLPCHCKRSESPALPGIPIG